MNHIATIEEIQSRLLNIAVTVRNILEKNNIKYSIAYGTLLGAVRHRGFIPWDDDFDFHIFDEDYEQALKCIRSELPDNLFLEDEKSEPLYFHGWAHVKDLNSKATFSLYPLDGVYQHKGLSVDLYRLNKIPASKIILFKAHEHLQYLKRKLKHGLITKNEFDKIEPDLTDIINREKVKISYDTNNHLLFACPEGNDTFDVDVILPLNEYSFNGYIFKGPNNSETYLSTCYNDYMTLPAICQRIPHFDKVVFMK